MYSKINTSGSAPLVVSGNTLRKCAALCVAASALVAGSHADAQSSGSSLQSAFNFTQYGTVAAGSTVTSNVAGSTSGVLQGPATTLSSAGLIIAPGVDSISTGIQLNSGSLSSFGASFSVQQFYTLTADPGANTFLFGGVTQGPGANLIGDTAFFVGYGGGAVGVRPIESDGTEFGALQLPPDGTGRAPGNYDLVITYSAASQTFTEYLNGTQVAQGVNTAFTSLSSVGNFSLGGVRNNPFATDNSVGQTTAAFRFYTGALNQTEVTALNILGASATATQINAVLVPEPSTWVMAVAGLGLFVGVGRMRRRIS